MTEEASLEKDVGSKWVLHPGGLFFLPFPGASKEDIGSHSPRVVGFFSSREQNHVPEKGVTILAKMPE